MKKTYKLVDLDCANCARKMEEAIRKINGVQDVSVSFLSQKLTLTADDAQYESVLQEAVSDATLQEAMIERPSSAKGSSKTSP